MSQLCYNRGCGQRFDPENNTEGESGGRGPGRGAPLAGSAGSGGGSGLCGAVPALGAVTRPAVPRGHACGAGAGPALPKVLKATGFSAAGLCGGWTHHSYQRLFVCYFSGLVWGFFCFLVHMCGLEAGNYMCQNSTRVSAFTSALGACSASPGSAGNPDETH